MKKVYHLVALTAMMLMASCQTIPGMDTADDTASASTTTTTTRNVQFVMRGLDVDYGTTSKATLASESITDLFVWEGTTLLSHQTSTDTDFGAPTVALTVGAHDLTFVASKATGQSWAIGIGADENEQGVWYCTKVADTYGTTLSYTVSTSTTTKQVQLTRLNAKLMWTIEDAIPTSVSKMSLSVPQCYGLDASLNGVSASTYTVSNVSITSMQGKTGYAPSVMVLPASQTDGSTISPTITFDDGTTYTTECQVKPNIVTNIHGTFFTATTPLTLSLTSTWGTQNDVNLK